MYELDISTQLLTFANSCIAIDYAGSRAAELITFLYGFFPKEQLGIPTVRFRLISTPGHSFQLYQDQILLATSKDEATIAEYLLGLSCYQLATMSGGGLLLHAAAVALHNQSIIFVGASGTGKSTLTAWLLSKGFTYLTDELVFIANDTVNVATLPRPLNLKKASRSILHKLINYNDSQKVMTTNSIDLVSPLLLQSKLPQYLGQLKMIVFPKYQVEGNCRYKQLSTAQTGFRLMQQLLNARNLAQHGFSQVVQLAKMVTAYEVQYTRFEELEPILTEWEHKLENFDLIQRTNLQ
ncbi:MAG: hypothetical protein KF832_21180 [Caldilineaceae bacterium]|nr:hypothetical protein [Caldilineaceae bacterium]